MGALLNSLGDVLRNLGDRRGATTAPMATGTEALVPRVGHSAVRGMRKRENQMPPHKRDRHNVQPELVVSVAMTTIVLLVVLTAVKGSQNIVMALSAAVVAVLAVLQFVHDASG